MTLFANSPMLSVWGHGSWWTVGRGSHCLWWPMFSVTHLWK